MIRPRRLTKLLIDAGRLLPSLLLPPDLRSGCAGTRAFSLFLLCRINLGQEREREREREKERERERNANGILPREIGERSAKSRLARGRLLLFNADEPHGPKYRSHARRTPPYRITPT